jgi:hypothetical protein
MLAQLLGRPGALPTLAFALRQSGPPFAGARWLVGLSWRPPTDCVGTLNIDGGGAVSLHGHLPRPHALICLRRDSQAEKRGTGRARVMTTLRSIT